MDDIQYTLAGDNHLIEIASLRWALCTEDEIQPAFLSREEFIGHCVKTLMARSSNGDTCHWIARDSGAVIAVMTVIAVSQLPSPERPDGQWAYLTNCFVKPERRHSGIGTKLLGKVKEWCTAQDFEVVIVWPRNRAFPFYERAGFLRERDPLCLTPIT